VVRQDGSLAGYRWGIERKRSLIEHESAVLGDETKQENPKARGK
jgi:AraC family transcriptional regulator of adaptative response/methylated-DNA-[protein]-cysteine methyltransferase